MCSLELTASGKQSQKHFHKKTRKTQAIFCNVTVAITRQRGPPWFFLYFHLDRHQFGEEKFVHSWILKTPFRDNLLSWQAPRSLETMLAYAVCLAADVLKNGGIKPCSKFQRELYLPFPPDVDVL